MPRKKHILPREYYSKSDVERELIGAIDEVDEEDEEQREERNFLADMINDIEHEREQERKQAERIRALQRVLFCWK